MGKKRRNIQKSSDDHHQFNLDKFDDRPDDATKLPIKNDHLKTVNDGNGGGMSRAAKKRAKKRAKTSSSSTTAEAAAADIDVSNNDGGGEDVASKSETKSSMLKKLDSKKMQLPLDSDDDDDAIIQQREKTQVLVSKVDKVKKKKKKKDKKSKGKHISVKDSEATMDTDDEDDDNDGDLDMNDMEAEDDDIEPELEELLSTLTPLQILLLDRGAASASDSKESNDEAEEEAVPDDAGGAIIDPRHLIGDITTELRARILLSSLLSPSGVTVNEFYQQYWGKRPLLAALDDINENDDDDNNEISQRKISPEAASEAAKHVSRLNGFLNRTIIDEMIRKNKLRYGLDLNVTRYTDSIGNGLRHRITLDPPPQKKKRSKNTNDDGEEELEYVVANPNDVWSNVDTSQCTVRLLRPHEHSDNIHTLLSILESEFGCMVGSNAYLTPLNSQGFAPHYDDVDVFILQLEGYKRWRVYAPFNKRETLPRESSRDYTDKEVEENIGEEEMDVVLGPGDVLYLPRGWIHQAETVSRPAGVPKMGGVKDDHSLHLTVSAMQNWCWADFLEILIPEALESAATSDKSTSLREGLPRNFVNYMGTMHQDDDGETLPEGLKQASAALKSGEDGEQVDEDALTELKAQRRIRAQQQHFKDEAKKRIMRVCKQAMSMLDDACDQIGKRFLSDRLPPALLEPERALTKEAYANKVANYHDAAKKIWPNTLCRLVRPGIARLVIEDSQAVLYHCNDNSRVYHGTPLSPMEFEIDDAPAIEQLLTTVEPHWIMVKDLIHGDVEDKMEIAQALYDEGILATMLTESPDRSVQTG
jgi:lysine-specific demethylase/histidyl-hydroxylase NO66